MCYKKKSGIPNCFRTVGFCQNILYFVIPLETLAMYIKLILTCQELRDISSMAMEYFDEKIVPTLKMPVSPMRWNNSPYNIFTSGTGLSLSFRYSDSLSPPSTPLCRLPIHQPATEPSNRYSPYTYKDEIFKEEPGVYKVPYFLGGGVISLLGKKSCI